MIRTGTTKPKKTTDKRLLLIVFILGAAVLSYIAILFGACYRVGDNILTWITNFNRFVIEEGNFIVGFTGVTPILLAVFLSAWTLGFLLVVTKVPHPYKGEEYGSARFQSPQLFTKKYSNKDKRNLVEVNTGDVKISKPVIVNDHNRWISNGCYVDINNKRTSNLNTIVIGPPGCGKTLQLARPVLSGLNGMYIVTDPKGELCASTGQYFKDNGYEVMVVNTQDAEGMDNSVRFNPFSYIRDQKNIHEMVEILLKSTTHPDVPKEDPFWEKSENMFFTSLFELIFYSYPKEKQNWRSFIGLIERSEVIAGPNGDVLPNSIMNEMEKYNELWIEEHDGQQHPAYKTYMGIFDAPFQTVASIVLSAKVRVAYMKLESALSMLDYDEMDIRNKFALGIKTPQCPTGKRILYIITQESDHSMDWYISILYMTFFQTLYRVADKEFHGALPHHITYLMDEFANVTLASNFKDLLSTMRSRNMSAIMIVQSLLQIKEKYPQNDEDKQLIGQCCFRIMLGPPEQESRDYFSKMLGTETINKASTTSSTTMSHSRAHAPTTSEDVMEKPLLRSDDLGRLDPKDCTIQINGDFPVYDNKVKFIESPFYKLLCREVPYEYHHKKSIVKRYFYCGKEAEDLLEEEKRLGTKIITLSEKDVTALIMQSRSLGKDPLFDVPPEDMEENRKAFKERIKQSEIDFDEYSPLQVLCVQKLISTGFSPEQIHAMDPFIKGDQKIEELLLYFNPSMDVSRISQFTSRILKTLRQKQDAALG